MCGTSVPSERLFSKAGKVVAARRSSIKPKNVFLHKNPIVFWYCALIYKLLLFFGWGGGMVILSIVSNHLCLVSPTSNTLWAELQVKMKLRLQSGDQTLRVTLDNATTPSPCYPTLLQPNHPQCPSASLSLSPLLLHPPMLSYPHAASPPMLSNPSCCPIPCCPTPQAAPPLRLLYPPCCPTPQAALPPMLPYPSGCPTPHVALLLRLPYPHVG